MDMSVIITWLGNHGLDLLQSFGIIVGLSYTALSFRHNSNVTRLSCRQQIMLSHREIWDRYADNMELRRMLDPSVNIQTDPITHIERRFATNLIQHVGFLYSANKYGMIEIENSSIRDIRETFNLPIMKSVWVNIREYQDSDYAQYMDAILKTPNPYKASPRQE